MAYTGKILKIDLSTGKSKVEPLNRMWAENYLGGKGLAIKYLYEEITPGIDPLSPDNKLILMTGPLTGTIVPNSGKLAIAAKSPATGTVLDCSIGGHFAAELKFAGYDAVIITGKAKVPVYIYIEDDQVELKSAAHLWGKNTHQAEFILNNELEDAKTLLIGQAGENQVIMSCITSEFYRQAGRGGIGAVLGSKNLKAVAVKGSGGLKFPDIRKLMREINKIKNEDTLTDDNLWAYTDGTAMLVDACQSIGTLPTRNFQDGVFEGFEQIGTEALKKVRVGKKACFSCPLACGNYSKAGEAIVEGPEYETLALCGSNCGIDDLAAVIEFNRLCDDYGVDTISTGNITAFAMEMTEKGVHDFGLRFGDKEAYLKVPRLIALKDGIGADLALGTKALSEKYGGKEFAMQAKGLEFPGYEPRGSWGMGLAYATAVRGACHMQAWPIAMEAMGDLDPFTSEGKGQLVADMQNENAVKFSAIFCDFWAASTETQAKVLNLVMQKEFTEQDLLKIGERIVQLARLFNQREGFTREHDSLPERIFKDPVISGPAGGKTLPRKDFEKMLADYYTARGWDEQGKIPEERIRELSL